MFGYRYGYRYGYIHTYSNSYGFISLPPGQCLGREGFALPPAGRRNRFPPGVGGWNGASWHPGIPYNRFEWSSLYPTINFKSNGS